MVESLWMLELLCEECSSIVASCTSNSSAESCTGVWLSSSGEAGSMNAPIGTEGGALQLTASLLLVCNGWITAATVRLGGFLIRQWSVFSLFTRVNSDERPCPGSTASLESRPRVTERAITRWTGWNDLDAFCSTTLSCLFSARSSLWSKGYPVSKECCVGSVATSAMTITVSAEEEQALKL